MRAVVGKYGWAYTSSAALLVVGIVGEFVTLPLNLVVAQIAAIQVWWVVYPLVLTFWGFPIAWLAGFAGIVYLSFARAPKEPIRRITTSNEPMKVEFVDGLTSTFWHMHLLLWWETPPRAIIDSTREHMPFMLDYTIWECNLMLRIIRTPGTFYRGQKIFWVHIGIVLGVLPAWFILRVWAGPKIGVAPSAGGPQEVAL